MRGRPDHRPPGWLVTALVGKSSHGPSVLQPPVTAPALLRITPTPRAAQTRPSWRRWPDPAYLRLCIKFAKRQPNLRVPAHQSFNRNSGQFFTYVSGNGNARGKKKISLQLFLESCQKVENLFEPFSAFF